MAVQPVVPILTEPKLVEPIWGGSRLADWLELPEPRPACLGEAWLVFDTNLVVYPALPGVTLAELTGTLGAGLVGSRTLARYDADFPLLAKFIDAGDRLSIQVHPDDTYAHTVEAHTGFHGKTEAWYILDAAPGATVTCGLSSSISRDEFAVAIANGVVEDLMVRIPVSAGDLIYVPAGTLHAINAGILLFEIQQKSDLTYRVYDYGRLNVETQKPRELHLDKALDVSTLAPALSAKVAPLTLAPGRDLLIACPYFALERYQNAALTKYSTDQSSFEIWTVIDGAASLHWPAGSLDLRRGVAAVLPAALGAYELRPSARTATLLRAYVPDLQALAAEALQCGHRDARVAEVIRP